MTNLEHYGMAAAPLALDAICKAHPTCAGCPVAVKRAEGFRLAPDGQERVPCVCVWCDMDYIPEGGARK